MSCRQLWITTESHGTGIRKDAVHGWLGLDEKAGKDSTRACTKGTSWYNPVGVLEGVEHCFGGCQQKRPKGERAVEV